MTRPLTLALALSVLAAGQVSAAMSPPITPEVSSRAAPTGATAESNLTLMWSSMLGIGTHPNAVAAAAALEEGGYTDWRLPTQAELQAAVTDADPSTFGQAQPNMDNFWWSSKTQGNAWAFGVRVVTDANGYPIPSLSGQVLKTPPRSTLYVRCVRP